MESIFSEMPRVHVEWISLTCQMYRLINLIGHTWHPYFSEQGGWPNAYVFSKKLQSKSQSKITFNQCNSEEGDQDSGITGFKAEGYQARSWHNIEVEPAILVRIPPFSLVSPGCCTLVCTITGLYKKERGPVVLMFCFFKKYCRQYIYMEMETLLAFLSGILSKTVMAWLNK